MSVTKIYRKEENDLVLVGAIAPNVYNIYTSEESEVGTWIDGSTIYRVVITPSEVTLLDNSGDPYHYTYRTNVTINDLIEITNGSFLGKDSVSNLPFNAPCYIFIDSNNYLNFSSPTTISVNTGDFHLIIEYVKSEISFTIVNISTATSEELNDETADFKCSNDSITSGHVVMTGNSITLDNISMTSSNLTLNANDNVTLSDITSSGNLPKYSQGGYNQAILIKSGGNVSITDSDLNQTGYNSLEVWSLSNNALLKNVLIDNCTFGTMSNNTVNFYEIEDNAVITISNCNFSTFSNAIRLCNVNNVHFTLNLVNCIFQDSSEPSNSTYRAVIICQDYTSTTNADAITNNRFAPDKVTINVSNCYFPTNTLITAPANMSQLMGPGSCANPLLYVYCDKGGIVNYDATRYPTVNITNT